jgi:uncharacterized repeat protein (TIGR01451 family)
MQSFFEQLRQLRASKKKTVQTFTHSAEMRSQKPHHNFSPLKFPLRKGGKWMSHLLLLGTVMASPLTGVANAAPVTHLATQTATATGAGATGTPSIATFSIPSGKNRVLFIWATFERDHCSNADVTASLCVSGNTTGTGLGDNYPDPRVGTPPATTSNNQITAQVIGPGGTINKKNALVIGGTPSGDTRFINISTSPQGSPAGTAFFSVSSFHIVLFENEINTLLGGAASGTVSITLPDTSVPSNAGDDALLMASVFQNVEQTPTGFVRNATATAQVATGTPGNSTLSPAAYDAGQAPDEADDGKLVMGASSSTEGFLTPAGHVALATLSVTNAGGNYDTPNGNIHNEPNGFTGGAYFRNGGAIPNSLYSLQMGGAASTLVYGATNASFLLESDSSDAGDAPLSYGNPTHTIVNGIRIGASVDADAGFLNSSNATGDDTNGTDDEDGVTIPSLTQGQSASISVNVNQVTAGTGRLQGWIDWNGDGDFADTGEQIATNLQLAAGTTGTISVPIAVPANASASTFARFRWSTAASLTSTATATDGEVEDYAVTVAASPSDLTVTKSHAGSFTVGSTGTYSMSVGNSGGTATSGTITFTDTLPTGLTVNNGAVGAVTLGGANSANWTCNSNAANPQVITCTSSTAIATSGSSVFTFPVSVGLGTSVGTNSVTNTGSVSGGGQTNTANDSSSDPTTVLSPNLTISKSHTGNFAQGSTGAYSLTVGNSGTAATSGTTTVIDTLPTGLSIAAGAVTLTGTNAANWSCNAVGQTIACTSFSAIAISGSSTFGFNVAVASNAPTSVTNNVSVSGGNEATANNGNNSGTDPTTVIAPADLTIAKTHTGNFTVGTPGTYALTVSNIGSAATTGTITVTDTLPVGLTIPNGTVTLTGTNSANWSCSATGNAIACTSSIAIAASGNSTFNLTGIQVGATAAPSVTNTATVSGGGETNTANDSASDITTVVTSLASLSGTVFEDPNYGGGAGRPLSTTSTSPRSNATVELYNSTGNFVSSTITSASALTIGQYSFTGLAPGNYYVRVVNSTVSSSRPGYTSTLRSIQTFYTDASSGTPTNVLNHVGGEKPSTFDTGAATTGAQLNTTNFTFTTGAGTAIAAGQAESVTPVTISSSPITGIDFGYNFDTIVNTNNSGQGSLRQFITNSNALTNTGLAQQGLTAGQETSIFMIPDGVAHPGLRLGLTNQVAGTGSNSGAAVITILSPLDAVTDTNTTIDGSTQSTNVGDTNAGQVGSAPTVGVAGMAVPRVNRPEIVIDGRNLTNSTNADQYAITLNANYSILRGISIYGGKGNYASSAQGDSGAIRVGSTLGTNVTRVGAAIIEQNLVGTFADGSDPGSTLQNQRYGTICFGACEIKNNFLAFNGYATLLFGSGADGSKITGNEYQFNGPNIAPFTNPGMGSADGDTIGIWSASSILVEGNLIANTRGVSSNTLDGGKGIEIVDTLGHDTINNQIRNNTIDKSSTAGIGLYAGPSGNTIFQNIISNTTPTATSSSTAYVGAGILISATGADRNSVSITAPDRNTISQNSIFRNMGLGIDIDPRDWYMGDGVTANTGATSNIVPNIGMNYPVMSTSSLNSSGTLSVTGYVGKETTAGDGDADFANAKLEFFIADNTPANQDGEVILGDGLSKPHGEGKTYIGTCTTDTNGLFSCSFPNAGTLGLTNARDITATATDSVGNTSEFSSILSGVPSVNHPNVLLVKRITAINGTTASASGQNLAAYNEEPTNAYDDNDLTVTVPPQNPGDPALDTDKWPNTTGSTASTFLIGGINGGNVKSNDEVEYTIYFLSAGPVSAKGVQMCDRIPSHQTFVPDTFNSLTAAPNTTPVLPIGDRGIEVSQGSTAYGYTNIGDGDTARYYPPGSTLPSACTQPALPEDNGAIVVTLGNVLNATAPGTPTESYGFFRFRARVK